MIYCDSSFILDFIAFPLEKVFPNNMVKKRSFEDEVNKYWKNTSRQNRFQKIIEKIYNNETTNRLVYSPIVTLECIEKLVEENFKRVVSENNSIKSIQKSSRKEIGNSLNMIYQDYLKYEKNAVENPLDSFALNIFEVGLGNADDGLSLFELMPVDMESISISHKSNEFNLLVHLAQAQIGVADIMHLLVAKKLGCEYFITFDSDFVRMKKIIEENFNLKILNNIDEIYHTI